MTTLWDTTGTAVVKALAAERRAGGAVTSGLALTLVAVVDERDVAEAEAAATTAASRHPCRLLIVIRRQIDAPVPRLDAEVQIGGRLGPGESVVLRMYGRLALHAESVVLPLLAPHAPVVTWWLGRPPDLIAHDPLGVFADRRITDVARTEEPVAGLRQRAQDYAAGDTDLAWARITPWRATLASGFDTIRSAPVRAAVAGRPDDPAAMLLAGWLASRFGLPVAVEPDSRRLPPDAIGVATVDVELDDGHRVRAVRAGRDVVLQRAGQPDSAVALPGRDLGDLLAEELRRLDADQPYAEALGAATGLTGLVDRPAHRTHIWVDPALPNGATGGPASPAHPARPEQAGSTPAGETPTGGAPAEGAPAEGAGS